MREDNRIDITGQVVLVLQGSLTIASLAVLRDEYYVTGILPNAVHLQTMKVFGK